MAFSATITLTGTVGTDTGPFNLYSNTDTYTTAFATSIAKSSLIAGYLSNNVPNSTTTVRIKSTGTCTNYIDIALTYQIGLVWDSQDCGLACDKYYTAPTVAYYSRTNSFAIGTYLYTNVACTIPVDAGYYSQGANCLTVNSSGQITATGVCPQYYFYDMTDCNTLTAKVGRSTTDLATLGTPVAIIGLYNCSLVHTDTGRYTYYEPYDYDLDTKTFVSNCSDPDYCVQPPTYGTYNGKANNGDRGSYSDSCGPVGVNGTGLWTVYTYNNQPLVEGTKIYVNPIDAINQNPAGLSDPGGFSYGGYWWETAGGQLGVRNDCP
jgi:hypothetical protein